jgi:hypothetical protein
VQQFHIALQHRAQQHGVGTAAARFTTRRQRSARASVKPDPASAVPSSTRPPPAAGGTRGRVGSAIPEADLVS